MSLEEESRWNNYFLRRGNKFSTFWEKHLSTKRNILFVLGWGFDPRMCDGARKILEVNSASNFHFRLINYSEGPSSPSLVHDGLKNRNRTELESIIESKGTLEVNDITLRDANKRVVGPRNITRLFSNIRELTNFSDIVIDISALPISVYFPLIAKLLYMLDIALYNKELENFPNLHVVVSENIKMDECVSQQELDDEATLLYPFMSLLETENAEKIPKVWIPIMGRNQNLQIKKIATLIGPDETNPIIPSPSIDPRLGDSIILEYSSIFDELSIDPKNIIYGSEQNPFEVYREILATIHRYRSSLKTLGGCKIAISTLSTKLLSIAALLAAYESKTKKLNVGVAHVFSSGFTINEAEAMSEHVRSYSELFSLWIFGDCYHV